MVAVAKTTRPTTVPAFVPLFAHDLPEEEFTLETGFLDSFRDREVKWGPIGWVTYVRTYSRYQDPERPGGAHRTVPLGGMEEWWQTVARVVEGCYQIQQRHCYSHNLHFRLDKAQRSAQEMYRRIFDFKFLPPGRGLWMMGTDYIKRNGSAALNNCAFVSTADITPPENFSEPFTTLMDLSMLGVGVGFDTDGAGKVDIVEPVIDETVHRIPDTREGWVDAARRVLDAYVGADTLPVSWDYEAIRPAGTPIRGFGGIAAGPEPLQRLLEFHLPVILDPNKGSPLTSTTIVDIMNVIGKCVVSGNVRRSAEIAFGNLDDPDFLDLKNPAVAPKLAIEGKDSWRYNSNNSLYAEVGMDYSDPAGRTAINGEPGYFWLENAQTFGRLIDPPNYADARAKGANPCVEQTLEPYELCCLVETFPAHHEDYEDWEMTLKFAYLYAKTVTLLPTHLHRVNQVLLRNRRIGCSQSGVVQNFAKVGRREHFKWCDKGYKFVRKLDDVYSEWLATPKSVKVTSIKPSGSVSKLCGSTEGMHRPPAQFYIQRIRIDSGHRLIPILKEAGYYMEESVTDHTTMVVDFPVEVPNFTQGREDVSAAVQMLDAVNLQRWWADNQVSCTIDFNAEKEGPELKDLLESLEDQLKGISFLPYWKGETDEEGVVIVPYAQAPQQPISERRFREMTANLKPLDRAAINGDFHDITDRGCDSGACTI